jgi:hypothetical protein
MVGLENDLSMDLWIGLVKAMIIGFVALVEREASIIGQSLETFDLAE